LSGGANKGAYEVGVMKGMVDLLQPEEVTWDVASGVSAGAINTAGMAMFAVGKEKEMTDYLIGIMENLKTEKIYEFWDAPLTYGIYNESGFFNDTPLVEFLTDIMIN
jgi:predicted acylesterase/phospholipase RssA